MIQIYCGDSLDVLATMEDNSVDSIVTDPPYGLSFMGRKWDYDVPSVDIWKQCLRVLKPGGHLLAFAGTRTQHRMCVNIEDAGFEIRDMIAWVYGSGFPKSMNVGKAIDKAAGAERERYARPAFGGTFSDDGGTTYGTAISNQPITPEAQQWEGWGTALKPALEPITVARKPFKGNVANNVLEHGTGAINIDGCRVTCDPADFGDPSRFQTARKGNDSWDRQDKGMFDAGRPGGWVNGVPSGRWPANLIHDGSDEVMQLFPHTTSGKPSGVRGASKHNVAYADVAIGSELTGFGDSGSAARFFQQCGSGYNEAWQDLNLPQSLASTADSNSSQQRARAVSALARAASSVLPEATQLSAQMAPSTTATGSELRLIAESVTQTILSIAPRFWHELQPTKLSLTSSPVSVVVQRELTGITTITASHWKSDGSADPATFVITPMNLEHGERDYAARFKYCAKANKKDREDGNTHPTVKPTDLMAYLCRLVTPPGGVVLDPFMGSGSTGKAALREGFEFIGIDKEEEYVAIASKRLHVIQRSILASRSADQNG